MSFSSRHQSQLAVESRAPDEILLTILEGARLRVFRLSANDERVVTVGAAPGADVQFERPDVSPIHFYFERLRNEIWIVPAYCVSGLRVNGVNLTTPQRLASRARVEFSGVVLDLDLAGRSNDEVSGPSRVSSDARRSTSEDDVPTRQAWSDREAERPPLQRSLVTVMVPRQELVSMAASMAGSDPCVESDDSNLTENDSTGNPLPTTVHVSSIIPIPPERAARESADSIVKNAPRPVAIANIEVPSLKRTLHGVSPTQLGLDLARLAQPTPKRCRTQVLASPIAGRARRQKRGLLFRMGQLARRRPRVVFTTAVLSALFGATLVVLAANAMFHSCGHVRFEHVHSARAQ